MEFPDLEQVVEDVAAPYGYACKFTPEDFDQRLDAGEAVILVARVGGTDDGITDKALIQVAVWGGTRPIAWGVAQNVAGAIRALQYGGQVGSVFIDTTSTAVGRIQVPDQEPDDRRVIAVYQFDARRQ